MVTVELGEILRVGETVEDWLLPYQSWDAHIPPQAPLNMTGNAQPQARIRRMRNDHLHIGRVPPPLGSGTDGPGDVGEIEGRHLPRWLDHAWPRCYQGLCSSP
eukprot:750618-Pyramimonas_sp.AAC.1